MYLTRYVLNLEVYKLISRIIEKLIIINYENLFRHTTKSFSIFYFYDFIKFFH